MPCLMVHRSVYGRLSGYMNENNIAEKSNSTAKVALLSPTFPPAPHSGWRELAQNLQALYDYTVRRLDDCKHQERSNSYY